MRLKVEIAGLTPLNGCRRCGSDFSSLRTFDRHMVTEEVEGLEIRRCLDHDEILALGWEEKIPGRWVDAVAAAKARESFARATEPVGASASPEAGEEAA